MKKLILLAIAVTFILSYGSIVCAQADPYGGARICPLKPYRLSLITSPNFIYLDPPTNKIVQQWMQVQWTNNGTATAYGVTATISCLPPGTTSPENNIVIGDIAPGASVWCTDDFQLIIDTNIGQIGTGVCWEATYKDAAGNTYVVTDIAKFCGEDCCVICDCTVIELDSFTAVAGNKNVTLTWVTASERDNSGFNIYRADSEDGNYAKINSEIIPAQGSPVQSTKYTYTDSTAKNRKTYFYKLEDVDMFGKATLNGPYSATPRLFSLSRILKRFKIF
jgi:hypothetical protein